MSGGERRIDLEPGWLAELGAEFEQPYMQELRTFLLAERRRGVQIYPEAANWFAAFRATPFHKVKVVILGQDPYHGPGQAHGLCFSVPPGVAPPPSLLNVFAELERDLGLPRPAHGCLSHWAEQGEIGRAHV